MQEGANDGVGGQIFIALVSFASLVWTEWARVVRRQQIVLFGALVLVLGLKDVSPFSTQSPRSRSNKYAPHSLSPSSTSNTPISPSPPPSASLNSRSPSSSS